MMQLTARPRGEATETRVYFTVGSALCLVPISSIPPESNFMRILTSLKYFDETSKTFILPINNDIMSTIIAFLSAYMISSVDITPAFCQCVRELGLLEDMRPYMKRQLFQQLNARVREAIRKKDTKYRDDMEEMKKLNDHFRSISVDVDKAFEQEQRFFEEEPEPTVEQQKELKIKLEESMEHNFKCFAYKRIAVIGKQNATVESIINKNGGVIVKTVERGVCLVVTSKKIIRKGSNANLHAAKKLRIPVIPHEDVDLIVTRKRSINQIYDELHGENESDAKRFKSM
jgi:hypothetical protein